MSNKLLSKPSNPSQSDLGVKMGKCEKSIGGSREFKCLHTFVFVKWLHLVSVIIFLMVEVACNEALV